MGSLASPEEFALKDEKVVVHAAAESRDSEETPSPSGSSSPTTKLLDDVDDNEHDKDRDIEALVEQTPNPADATPVEYTVPTSRKLIFLGLYFFLNLSVTLGNKGVLRNASFPWMLTFCHTSATAIGCSLLLASGRLQLTKLTLRENLILVAFSTLFTLNIAISNVSLALVSVPFHQVMRSSGPIVTICIYRVVFNRTYARETYISLIPLFIGVGLATFGDYYFSAIGFALTLLGVLLASIKTVATNRLMTGSLKLSAMEVLFRMSPLAALQCLLYAFASGELSSVRTFAAEGSFSPVLLLGIAGNAAMAFALNIVSFQTNKVAGALTISVCGNIKQCLTILLGILLFSVRIMPLNGIGMFIAVCGAAYYSKVELDRKKASSG